MADEPQNLELEPTQVESPPGQPPPVHEAEPEPEGTKDVGGEKVVPLKVLQEERKASKVLKERAQQYDQLAGYVGQVKPYIDFLSNHPELMQPRGLEPRSPVKQADPVDEAAIELARTLDLYDAEGKPDAVRAAKLQRIISKNAEAIADARIGPITENTAREKASRNYQAAQTWEKDGLRPTPQTVHTMFSTLTPELASDERVAYAAWLMALGQDVLDGKAQRAARGPEQEPVETEPSGGRTFRRPPMTEVERAVASLRGLSDQKFTDLTKGYKDKGPSVLEDD